MNLQDVICYDDTPDMESISDNDRFYPVTDKKVIVSERLAEKIFQPENKNHSVVIRTTRTHMETIVFQVLLDGVVVDEYAEHVLGYAVAKHSAIQRCSELRSKSTNGGLL